MERAALGVIPAREFAKGDFRTPKTAFLHQRGVGVGREDPIRVPK